MNIERFKMQEWDATLYFGRAAILNVLKTIEGKTIEKVKAFVQRFMLVAYLFMKCPLSRTH